jgi:sulfopyruvate decarboxylase alpha subunit
MLTPITQAAQDGEPAVSQVDAAIRKIPNSEPASRSEAPIRWPARVYEILKAADVRQMTYVPDAGHTTLINLFLQDAEVVSNVLTTEEEGVAIAAGAWLGGRRSVLLMQSSGVGNCINMLSLPVMARFPLLMLVTMRGEWAEFNPWQVPMAQATQAALEAVGVRVMRADAAEDLIDTVESAAALAFHADQQIAVLIGQRLLGKKKW